MTTPRESAVYTLPVTTSKDPWYTSRYAYYCIPGCGAIFHYTRALEAHKATGCPSVLALPLTVRYGPFSAEDHPQG